MSEEKFSVSSEALRCFAEGLEKIARGLWLMSATTEGEAEKADCVQEKLNLEVDNADVDHVSPIAPEPKAKAEPKAEPKEVKSKPAPKTEPAPKAEAKKESPAVEPEAKEEVKERSFDDVRESCRLLLKDVVAKKGRNVAIGALSDIGATSITAAADGKLLELESSLKTALEV